MNKHSYLSQMHDWCTVLEKLSAKHTLHYRLPTSHEAHLIWVSNEIEYRVQKCGIYIGNWSHLSEWCCEDVSCPMMTVANQSCTESRCADCSASSNQRCILPQSMDCAFYYIPGQPPSYRSVSLCSRPICLAHQRHLRAHMPHTSPFIPFYLCRSLYSSAAKSSRLVTVSYTHLTLPTNREV